jgi:hypothetical protein
VAREATPTAKVVSVPTPVPETAATVAPPEPVPPAPPPVAPLAPARPAGEFRIGTAEEFDAFLAAEEKAA